MLQRAGVIVRNPRWVKKGNQLTTDHVLIKQAMNIRHSVTNHPANLQINVLQSLNSSFEYMRVLDRAAYLPNWMKLSAGGAASTVAGWFINN